MAIRYLSGVNIDTNTFFVDSTNNKVGIGTGTPSAKLDIDGAHVASIGLLRLNSSAANMSAMTYYIDGVYKAATYAGTDDNFYVWGRDADIVFNTTTSGTTRMVITNGGNVGIGTTGPTQKLMVGGSIRVTGGYYDSSNSIGSNGQVLASTGTGTAWINVGGGTVNGSGTVNYLSKWTGTTLLGDSQLFDNGTNVGIGTATPAAKLDVSGNVRAAAALISQGGNNSWTGAAIFMDWQSTYGRIGAYNYATSAWMPISLNDNSIYITGANGNIGLGNTSPSQKLHVEGNIRVTGAYYDSANGAGSSGQVLSSTGSGTSWITPFSGSGTTNYVAKWTSGTAIGNSQVFDNGTNVGIGTAAPNNKLSVIGNIEIQSGGSKIGFNVNDAFSAYGTSVAHYGISYGLTANPLALSGYFGVGVFTSGTERMRIDGSGNVGIGTTSPSRLLHVAGNAQVDGWLYQGGYYSGSVTLPYPGANYGNGRIYLRLCSSASSRIMTAKVRISSTWNWAPAFGSVEADISFYWTGSSMAYAYVNILSATGQAATNLTFGALEVEGGSISVPVYSTNSNPIYAYIQLSPDADPSQVSYSTWSSVAFPGQANVYIQTNLGVGTPSPGYRLDVNGTFHAGGDATFNGTNTYINSSYIYVGNNTADLVSISGNTVYLPGDGNVGIGNTAPTQKLHVTGNVRVTGAYYDSSNAAGTSGQILSSTGTGTAWISPGGGGGIITGSGTTNYVTRWTGTSAVGDSSIFDNGNVGIGTATPASKLDVNGGTNTEIRLTTSGSGVLQVGQFTNGAYIGTTSSDATAGVLRFGTDSSERMRIASSGNVGIGTTTPQKPLEVISGANDFVSVGVNQISVGNWTGIHFGYREANSLYRKSAIVFERTDLTANDAQGKIHILNGPQGSNGSATLADAKLTIAENGNVGIGTTVPAAILHVSSTGANAYSSTITKGSNMKGIINTLSNNADDMVGIYFGTGTNSEGTHWSGITGSRSNSAVDWSTQLNFYTHDENVSNITDATQKMVIKGSGNVGIGTTAPGFKTTISADITKSGDINPGTAQLSLEGATTPGKRMILGYDTNSNGFGFIKAGNYGVTWTPLSLQPDGGNVGIGETAPSQKLHVSGNIRVTGAYYDSANSAGTSGQILSSTGTGTAWIAAPSGGITGSGTTNYITKWTSGSAVGNSVMYDNGTNVGIGTTAPNEKLHVFGSIEVSGFQSIGNGPLTMLKSSYNGGAFCQVKLLSYNPNNASDADFGLQVMDSGGTLNEAIRVVGNTLNVGIGTTAPLKRLVVTTGNNTNSSSNKSDALAYFGGGNDNPNAQNISFPNPSITDGSIPGMAWWSADVMFGRYKNEAFWSIKETHGGSLGGSQRDIIRSYFYDSGGYSYIDKTVIPNGNVGIGTTAPNAKLDVAGGINTRNTRVNSAEKYPVGHYSFGETVFEIDPTWTEAQLQDYFNSSGVTWVADSTAPGGYAIQIDGSVNVGAGEYDSGFPYIPVDNSQDDWYYMECYIKNDAGSSIQHYMGGIDFNQSFASLGGNPGSYTYNVMFNYNPGTSWTKVYGYWNGFGSSYGSAGTGNTNNWVSGTKYFTPQALFNYGLNSGIRRCYISGWKCVRVRATGNRYYSNNVLVSGNVGVGTTAPDAKLVVTGDGSGTAKIGSAGFGGNYTGISLNGTLNTVSYNFLSSTSDNHLYINRPTGNDIYFRLANNDQVTIKASGNVGIGTMAPESLLHLSQASAGGDGAFLFIDNPASSTLGNTAGIRFATNAGASFSGYGSFIQAVNTNAGNGAESLTFGTWNGAARGERMRIDSSGSVGINTTNPGYKLDVIGSVRSYGGLISNGYHADTYIENLLPAANNGSGQGDVQLRMWCSEPGITWSWAGFGYNVKNDGASPYGFGRVNTSFGQAYMRMSTDGDWYFYNANTSGTRVTTMTLTNAGNVGIGTTAPGTKLQIDDTSSPTIRFNASSASGGAGSIQFYNQLTQKWNLTTLATTNDFALYNNGGTNSFNLFVSHSSGNVGIGTTAPAYKLDVSGTIRATGDVIAYSDARVKENVETLDGALDKVMKMRGVSYNKIGEQEKKVGVIAQEILEVLPEVVSQDETGTYSVAYGNIVSVLIEAIKELTAKVEELESKLK